jgi:hypothetical protein
MAVRSVRHSLEGMKAGAADTATTDADGFGTTWEKVTLYRKRIRDIATGRLATWRAGD